VRPDASSGPSTSPLGAMSAPSQVSTPLRSLALVWFTVGTWRVDWILQALNVFTFVGSFVLILADRASRSVVTGTALWSLLVLVTLIFNYIRPIDSLSYYKSVEWDVRYESPAQRRHRLTLTLAYAAFTAATTLTVVLLLVHHGRSHSSW